MARPRIAIVGVALEASTYSPARTRVADFQRRDGEAYFQQYPFFAPGSPLREAADWRPLTHYRAIPGGPVPLEDWVEITSTILDGLGALVAEGPVDGVLYDVHGAMSVLGVDDPEGELAAALREVVGPDALVSTGMDLHGNVSTRLATVVDLLTCYRMAPHEDAQETKERAARHLVDRLVAGAGRPVKARVPVPVLLPGERTSTRLEPAKGLYGLVPEVQERPGVLDAAIWIGYAWADEERNHAAVVVTGDDEAEVVAGAELLAARMWAVRDDFAFVAPTGSLAQCLDAAAASGARPFFVSDSGDNPTAGGAGDVTWTLARLLERPDVADGSLQVVYASIPDAGAARRAAQAGVGAQVALEVGARVDAVHEGPVALTGTVEHVHEGDPVAGTEVVVRSGGLRLLLTARRKPYHLRADFAANGIELEEAGVVVVKIGYLEPELFVAAADWMLALTPGGVDQDLARLPHTRIRRPMVPFDTPVDEPDLTAELVPLGDSAASTATARSAATAVRDRRAALAAATPA